MYIVVFKKKENCGDDMLAVVKESHIEICLNGEDKNVSSLVNRGLTL